MIIMQKMDLRQTVQMNLNNGRHLPTIVTTPTAWVCLGIQVLPLSERFGCHIDLGAHNG